MATIFACGAECAIVSGVAGANHWNVATGTVAISTATIEPGGGARSFDFNTATAVTAYHSLTVARTIISGRVYFYAATFPSVTNNFVSATGTGGNCYVRMTAAGQIVIHAVATGVNMGAVVALNTWHYVDFKFDASGASMVATAKLDGGTEYTTSTALASNNFTAIRFGATVANIGRIYLDHILLGDALTDYPVGTGQVTGYVPTSTGTHSQTAGDFKDQAAANITNGDGTWANVDELPANTTDYTAQVVIRTTSYAEYVYDTSGATAIPIAVEQIVSVVGGVANTEKAQLYDGTAAADAYALAATAVAVTNRTKHWTAAPSTGAWTLAKLQALRIRWGFSGDVTPNPRLTSTIVEVAYSGSVTHSGTLAVAGAGSLGNTGSLKLVGTDDVTGTGLISNSGSLILIGAHSVTGTGLLGQVGSFALSAALSLTGTGALGQSAGLALVGSDAVTGTGALGQTAGLSIGGALSVTGTGVVTRAGTLTLGGAHAVTGTGALGQAGGVLQAATLALAGTGALGQASTSSYSAALGVIGTGALGPAGKLTVAATDAVTGTGAIGFGSKASYAGAFAVTGTGLLGMAGGIVESATLAVTGTGNVTRTGTASYAGALGLTGAGLLGLTGTVNAGSVTHNGTLSITGTGALGHDYRKAGLALAPWGYWRLGDDGTFNDATHLWLTNEVSTGDAWISKGFGGLDPPPPTLLDPGALAVDANTALRIANNEENEIGFPGGVTFDDFTVIAWVNRHIRVESTVIQLFATGFSSYFGLSFDGTPQAAGYDYDRVHTYLSIGGTYLDQYSTYRYAFSGTNSLPDLEHWYMIAAVRSGTSMLLYVDGQDRSSGMTAPSGSFVVAGGQISIAAVAPPATIDYSVDELMLFNRTLSAAEILHLYKIGSGTAAFVTLAESVSLTGAGLLGASGSVTEAGSLSVTGAGTAVRTGTLVLGGVESVTGTGLIGESPTASYSAALAVTGVGLLGLTGSVAAATANLNVTGTGALGATPKATYAAGLALTGTGALGMAGTITAKASLAVTGTGALSPGGRLTQAGAWSASGLGSFGAGGSLVSAGALGVTGTGAIGEAGKLSLGGTFSPAGTGSFSAASSIVISASFSLAGSGALGMTPKRTTFGSWAVAGIGSLGVTGQLASELAVFDPRAYAIVAVAPGLRAHVSVATAASVSSAGGASGRVATVDPSTKVTLK